MLVSDFVLSFAAVAILMVALYSNEDKITSWASHQRKVEIKNIRFR